MKSNDYFEGYKQGVDDVLEKIKEAQNCFDIYGNKKTFKGLSRREIVFECWKIIQDAIKEYENEY